MNLFLERSLSLSQLLFPSTLRKLLFLFIINLEVEVRPAVHTSGRYGFAVMANINREQSESLKMSRRKVSVNIECRFAQPPVNDPSKILPKRCRLHLRSF